MPTFLNYTTLGLPRPQVFPFELQTYPNGRVTLVEDLLQTVCGRSDESFGASRSELWVVRNSKAPG